MSSKVEFLPFRKSERLPLVSRPARSGRRQCVELVLTPVLLGGLFKLTNNHLCLLFGEGKLEYDMWEQHLSSAWSQQFIFNPATINISR